MKYSRVDKSVDYIPMWDGNQEREKDEQIVFSLRYMTNAELSRCYETSFVNGEPVVETNNENLIKYGVESISGLNVNGIDITDARGFNALRGFTKLYTEIATQVMIQNARLDSGN